MWFNYFQTETLTENGISWKVYQNELYLDVGLGDKQPWLDNFGDNPLEYFTQFNARMHPEYRVWLPQKIKLLEEDIADRETKFTNGNLKEEEVKNLQKSIELRKNRLAGLKQELINFTSEKWESLTPHLKSIHKKAFGTNRNDPHYHQLEKVSYYDGNAMREMDIPKGDILKNFRDDAAQGKLPMVSWLAAPEHFSDHPSSAWFGAWYVSEVLDILTQNPEVWKKTILVLTYDENDGYFDHLPPYGAPNPYKENTGKVSAGIDSSVEFVRKHEQSGSEESWMRESNIGLGYRVPMIIASPWTRGGYVCSEVFDHTSSLQFLENFLQKKTGKQIIEKNISEWRRTVCGNLLSAFRPYNGEAVKLPEFLDREKFIQGIYNTKFKQSPGGFKKLSDAEINTINNSGNRSALLPAQERGIRNACPLPYELYTSGNLSASKKQFSIKIRAGMINEKEHTGGAPFYVYMKNGPAQHRDYAVKAGSSLEDSWELSDFENGKYSLHLYAPNGYYRAFTGNANDPLLRVECGYEKTKGGVLTGNLMLQFQNADKKAHTITINDESYKTGQKLITLQPGKKQNLVFSLQKSFSWYDVSITVRGHGVYRQQFAGHVETGKFSKTDPLMGGMLE